MAAIKVKIVGRKKIMYCCSLNIVKINMSIIEKVMDNKIM